MLWQWVAVRPVRVLPDSSIGSTGGCGQEVGEAIANSSCHGERKCGQRGNGSTQSAGADCGLFLGNYPRRLLGLLCGRGAPSAIRTQTHAFMSTALLPCF